MIWLKSLKRLLSTTKSKKMSDHENSFTYEGEYYNEEGGQYWRLKHGTIKMSVSKKNFYARKKKN